MQSPNSKQVAELRRAYKKLWLCAVKMVSLLKETQGTLEDEIESGFYDGPRRQDLVRRINRLAQRKALPRPEELP